MGAPDLTALGRCDAGFRAIRVGGGRIMAECQAETAEAALSGAGHGDGLLLRLDAGQPDTTPARANPGTGALPCLTQDRPADLLGSWARLIVAGFAAAHPNWDGVICLSEGGTSYWVHLSAGEIVSFQGFVTPRLATALDGADTPDPQAIADSLSRPERLAAHLRQASLAGDGRATTGHLIGAELAAARPYWLGQQVVLVAPGGAASPYAAPLTEQGVPTLPAEADELVLAGLAVVFQA